MIKDGKNGKKNYLQHVIYVSWVNPIPTWSWKKRKWPSNLCSHFFCDALKGFMKALKAPQRSVKRKIYVNLYFNAIFWNARGGIC